MYRFFSFLKDQILREFQNIENFVKFAQKTYLLLTFNETGSAQNISQKLPYHLKRSLH